MLNKILNESSDLVCTLDAEGKILWINEASKKILGFTPSKIEGRLYSDFVHEDDLKKWEKVLSKEKSGENLVNYEIRQIHREGNEVQLLCTVLWDSTEKKYYCIGKTNSNEKIRQSNERFKNVAKATNDAIYDWNFENNELFLGEGFNLLFGHDITNTTHSVETWIDHLHPEDKTEVSEDFMSFLQNKEETNFYAEYRYLKSDGTYAYVINRGIVIRDETGSAQRMVGAVADITQRKNFEESLQKLNENLEQHAKELAISNSELEQFAFVTSHDLQEPLRMISSFLTQLERKYGDQLDEKAHQYIHFAVDGAKRMRQIILDLLDFSTIGKSVDLKESVDIDEIVEEISLLQRKLIEETDATIIKENLPTILAQRGVIIQIFQNLIGNAIKFRKEEVPPKVVISAKEKKEEWIFSIKDNGIGIEEDYFDKIFTIFQKLHSKEMYGGTGMGLAIVKKSVENLGGNIWVESTPGVGSNFKFSIKKMEN